MVNTEFAWLAGRDRFTRAITLWRIPHHDLISSRVATDTEIPTSISQLDSGTVLTITTHTTEATATLRDVLADPNEP